MYLFFDTETAGLPRDWGAPASNLKNWPRLVRLTWLLADERQRPLVQQSRLFQPEGFRIPKSATLVHGVTTEQAQLEGQPAAMVLADFRQSLARAQYAVAHDLTPHVKFVEAEFIRAGLELPFDTVLPLCTMKTTVRFCDIKHQDGSLREPSLQQLYQKLFRQNPPPVEEPFAGVELLRDCFFGLKEQAVLPLPG